MSVWLCNCWYFLGFFVSCFSVLCRVLQGEKLRREKQLVKDIAEFLLLSQIPGFVSTRSILLNFVIDSVLCVV